jgi:hypothetical protein
VSESSPSLARLRADLHRAAKIDDVAQRALEAVAVIEEAAAPLGIRPTVVGGMAVYFWTEDGRHWELPGTEVLLEAPSTDLDADAQVAVVRLPSGRTARVLSRVDILLDRLDEFQATGHQLVAQQALVLLVELTDAEQADLDARAPGRRLTVIVDAMRQLARELSSRSEPPASDELHEIARAALRAEYSQRQP